MKVVFFNHYHNGDLVLSKEFVREFISFYPEFEFYYAHLKHPKVLLDLNCNHISLRDLNLPQNLKFIKAANQDLYFINTWIGSYTNQGEADEQPFPLKFDPVNLDTEGINWKAYYRIWEYTHQVCNLMFNKQFVLREEIELYAHSIDYSKYNCNPDWLSQYQGSVLISNGFVESGQTHINHDMSSVIKRVAYENPNKTFICTKRFETDKQNIVFTDNIMVDSGGCDLNEIAYLSQACDIIIGRNSGPFLFTNTLENLNDSNKKFLVFNKAYNNCSPAFLDYPCYFKFVEDVSEDVIYSAINDILTK
jgi:hypothetical protein